jgi:hypothetical protein
MMHESMNINSIKICCMEKSFGKSETQRMSRLQKFCQNDTFQFSNVATNNWLQNIMNRYKVLSCKPSVHLINCYAYILSSPRRYLYFVVVVGLGWSNDPGKEGYSGPPGWGLKHGANNLTSIKKILLLRSLIMDASWITDVKRPRKI